VELFDAMPSVGRIPAGGAGRHEHHARGRLPAFVSRYGRQANRLRPALDQFGPQKVRDWVHGLGVDTFVGTSAGSSPPI
jgi:predicted flavoprotein YhiN